MGTTNKPLVIWVEEKWLDRKEVKALQEKGHHVTGLFGHDATEDGPNLIISENAWRWHDAYWEHIEVALKEARKGQPVSRAKDEVKRKPSRRKGPKSAASE